MKRSVYGEAFAKEKKILLFAWDPIGVRATSGATNEYDTYAETLFRLLFSINAEKNFLIICIGWKQSTWG